MVQAEWTVLEGQGPRRAYVHSFAPAAERSNGMQACRERDLLVSRSLLSKPPQFHEEWWAAKHQPLVQACKHEDPSPHCVLTAAESVSGEGEMQPRNCRTLEVKLHD